MSWTVIPAGQQAPGGWLGSHWIVLQAWPIANLWTLALLGPEGGRVVEGYGDWDIIPVRRGKPITEWKGHRAYTLSLDLLYDGWSLLRQPVLSRAFTGQPNVPWGGDQQWEHGRYWARGIESELNDLQRLATVQSDMSTPPSVRIWGAVHYASGRYVIQNLDWGDSIRDRNTGQRVRQQVTATLVEYYQPTELQKLPRGKAG